MGAVIGLVKVAVPVVSSSEDGRDVVAPYKKRLYQAVDPRNTISIDFRVSTEGDENAGSVN